MSALMLMSLLGFSLLLPIFSSTDLDAENSDDLPDDLPDDIPDQTVEGTDGGDLLSAIAGETLSGLAGNDTLTATDSSDGAVLDGGTGADSLSLEGINGTALGGEGADSITLTGATAPDGASNLTADGGAGDDTITASGFGGTILGGGAEDVITAEGTMDSISGGEGNDTIFAQSGDIDQGTPIDGGTGNDVIEITEGLRANSQSSVSGGEGDDRLSTQVVADASLDGVADIFTGGAGNDIFQVSLNSASDDPAEGASFGTLVEITDFNTAEDAILLELGNFGVFQAEADAPNQISFDLNPAANGTDTLLSFTIANANANGPISGDVLLSGVTGLNADAVDFSVTFVDATA